MQGKVNSYPGAVNYLLETVAKDDIIVKTVADMTGLTELSNKWPTEVAEALWNKAPRCKNCMMSTY